MISGKEHHSEDEFRDNFPTIEIAKQVTLKKSIED